MEKERADLVKKFIEINSQINLSAIRDEEWIYIKHILDSIELDKVLKFKNWSSVCDIGTGGWFPLVPLAMTNPDINFIWIDSVNKKLKAVWEIISFLWLKNINLVWTRAEDFHQKFNYVVVRSVWYVDKLFVWSRNLIKSDWYLILYKWFDLQERKDLIDLSKKHRLKLIKEHKYRLFEWDIERVIYVLKKRYWLQT
jgi:16S rRNA (guanine527-N7)-methyltransferase